LTTPIERAVISNAVRYFENCTRQAFRLIDGNGAFAELLDSVRDEGTPARRVVQVDPRDLGLSSGTTAAPSQHPFAAVLGCSDARVPLELIFNEGPNDLFVIRVAGNGLGPDVLEIRGRAPGRQPQARRRSWT
jgi:carbonic anhydrase